MSKVTINGKTYIGDNVSITNGVVVIDGKQQEDGVPAMVEIKITEGVLHQLKTDASVICGDVMSNVIAGGSVSCADVRGSVQAGGSVSCGNVGGSVQAGGSISHG